MVDEINVKRYVKNEAWEQKDLIVKEHRANIFVNGEPYISLMCLPEYYDELAVGFLFSEGVIGSYEDVVDINSTSKGDIYVVVRNAPDNTNAGKRVIVSGFAHGSVKEPFLNCENLAKVTSSLKISSDEVLKMMASFNKQSELFQKTGAVHSSSLVLTDGTTLFYEDIGRHNAVDKIIGKASIANLCIENGILLTSGRISSEILIKTARLGIPVLISISAPTNMAVDIARKIDMTLIGFVRGDSFNVYSGDYRLI